MYLVQTKSAKLDGWETQLVTTNAVAAELLFLGYQQAKTYAYVRRLVLPITPKPVDQSQVFVN